jgi:hypothetical protein
MPQSTKNFKQLLEQYNVRADWSSIDSNIVYPMDAGSKYEFHGYINQDDLQPFLKMVRDMLDIDVERGISNRIANKYAIPYLQVGHMHTLQTFFYYQHDNKTWLISLKENVKEYLG